jgi:hypothetical protein
MTINHSLFTNHSSKSLTLKTEKQLLSEVHQKAKVLNKHKPLVSKEVERQIQMANAKEREIDQ